MIGVASEHLYEHAQNRGRRGLYEHALSRGRRGRIWSALTGRSRRLYTVEDEGRRPIGSLTLRDIDGRRSARLGITIGADFVSQGYGTEALRIFLDYYFGEMGFARLVLDVAATNLRAVRTYQALGFHSISEHYQSTNHPSYRILRQDSRYRHLQQYFRRMGTVYQVLFYDMALTREEWWAIRQDEKQGRPEVLPHGYSSSTAPTPPASQGSQFSS